VLGDNLDLDRIEAAYADGVLRLVVPVAEKAKPRKIQIGVTGSEHGDEHGHDTVRGSAEREAIEA
jgi:HSP20 family protein